MSQICPGLIEMYKKISSSKNFLHANIVTVVSHKKKNPCVVQGLWAPFDAKPETTSGVLNRFNFRVQKMQALDGI